MQLTREEVESVDARHIFLGNYISYGLLGQIWNYGVAPVSSHN